MVEASRYCRNGYLLLVLCGATYGDDEERPASRLKPIRHACLEPFSLSASCHEGMVNGWVVACGEEFVDFVGRSHLAGRMLQ